MTYQTAQYAQMELTAAFLYEDLLVSQLNAHSRHIYIDIQLKKDVPYTSNMSASRSKPNWARIALAGNLWLAVLLSGAKIMDY
ncbi:unnamed protein product [Fusarium venenatum]|uniref:Uncharacterized protein n=1 Tax=Fusarium venenatum TaxID=56646 RepID=A0A2L2TG08_9HYPO|nr:uncharacterized protein FVRRES_09105 [Fusarium venenatum]CEI69028.1 unnamed protein product [Fusarium venenatum]